MPSLILCLCHNCPNRIQASNYLITYHSFPNDLELRNKWLENIGKKDMVVTTQSKICSLHFKESYINRTFDSVSLKDDAIPTEFIQDSNTPDKSKYTFEIDTTNLLESFNSVKDTNDCTEIDITTKIENPDDNIIGQNNDPLDVINPAILTIEFLSDTIEKIIQLLQKVIVRDTDRPRAEKVKMGVLNAISCYQEMIDGHQKQFLFVDVESPESTPTNEVNEPKNETLKDNSESKLKEGKRKVKSPTIKKKGSKKKKREKLKRRDRENKSKSKIRLKSKKKAQKQPKEDVKSDDEVFSEGFANDFSSEDEKCLKSQIIKEEEDPDDSGKDSCVDEAIELIKKLQKDTQSQGTSNKPKRKVYPKLVPHYHSSKKYNLDIPLVRYTCQECDISFTDPMYLDGHWKQCKGRRIRTWGVQPDTDAVQNQDGRFQCPMCPCTYNNKYNLKRHIVKHKFYQIQNDTNKMNTLISARKDPSLDENDTLNAVSSTNIGEENYDAMQSINSNGNEISLNDLSKMCEVNDVLDGTQDLIMDTNNDKSMVTSNIIGGSTSKDCLKYSLSRVLSDVPASEEILEEKVQCDQCDRSYKTRNALAFHIQYVHKDEGYAIVCNHCPTMFKKAYYLTIHVKRKHGVTMSEGHNYYMASSKELKKYTVPKVIELRVFMCKLCSKIFPTPKQLKRHNQGNCMGNKRTVPWPQTPRGFKKIEGKYICKICGKVYGSYGGIHRHTVYHNGEKPFECDICGQRLSTKVGLHLHTKTHSQTKEYICDECGKTFSHPSNMKRHKMAHAGHKPYKCEVCGKQFQFVCHAKVHMRTHTGEKPYDCDMCPQKFSDRRGFLAHVNKHKGIKPYKCNQCDSAFLLKKSLNKHLLEHTDNRTNYC